MRCPSCRAAVPDGSRFCSTCGFDLQARADERRVVTVLFGDLVGFTTMSEQADPERVKILVDRCFERLVRDIVAFGGRVDKIVGDAIVALFGAPVAHEDDPERAVRAALAMQATMRAYGAEVGAPIQMRIGVNTGEVLTGAMRAGGEYTAMGDVVNTANRLQAAAEGGEVLVGATTHQATAEAVAYEYVDTIQARGREEPVEAWRAVSVLLLPGRHPRRRRSPLVGRDAELSLLRQAVDLSFTRGRGNSVLLLGDAGVGKTRLADELAEWAACEHGARHVESQCVPYGEANIWYPLGAAVRELCGVSDDASPEEARAGCVAAVAEAFQRAEDDPDVVQVADCLLYLMGYEGPLRHLEPQRARDEASRSVAAFVEAICETQPLLFRLADLHWADDLVLGLLDDLLNRLSRSRFCLVAGARHLIDARWAPHSGRHNSVTVNLDPLDETDAAHLLDYLVDGKDVPADLRDTLLSRSGGNPFFLEELVALTDRSAEPHVGNRVPVRLGADRPGRAANAGEADLPETLRGLVAARLDRLRPEERMVVEDAAVIGRSGPLYALEVMASRTGSEDVWRAALDQAVEREILDVVGTRWSFRSDLVREVAYSTLTKSDRARRHADIALWAEQQRGADGVDDAVVDRIAYHFAVAATLAHELGLVAGLPVDLVERALHWLGEAGRRAQAAEVHVLAARLFSQALELAGPEPSGQRLDFLLGRAQARWGLFELDLAAADVHEALAVALALGDERGRARALLARAEVEHLGGQLAAAHATLDDALAAFRALGDRRKEAETLRQLGMTRLFQRAYKEAESSTQEALEIFSELGDRRGEAWALQNLAWVAYLSGRVAEAEARISEAFATFAEIGDRAGLAWANGLSAFTRFHQGHMAEAEQLGEQLLPDAHERGDRFGEAMMLLLTALVRLWSGRTAAAIERADEARTLFSRIGDSMGQSQAEATYGRALVASGRIEEGLRELEETLTRFRRNQAVNGSLLGSLALVSSALHVGRVDLAARQLPPLEVDGQQIDEMGEDERAVALALVRLQQGDPAEGVRVLQSRLEPVEPGPNTLAALALTLAAAGDSAGALQAADRAHDSRRATYLDLAHAYVASGLAYAARGDTSEVIAAFASARQEVDRTGDVVAQAVVRLGESFALRAVGATSARGVRREAERRLSALGTTAEGWSVAFESAVRRRDVSLASR